MEQRKKTITSEYRKMAMAAESIEEKASTIKDNFDIVLLITQIVMGGLIAICALLILLYGLHNWSFIEDNIPGGWKTFTAAIITMLGTIYAEYKTFVISLHTDHGEIKKNYVEKAKKSLDQIDRATGLSIPSTIISQYTQQIPPNTSYRNVQATEIIRGDIRGDSHDVVFEQEQNKN